MRLGCSGERIRVIPHGTNINYFQPKARNVELAKKIGLSVEDLKKVIALFSGEFSEVKGAEYVMEAILSLVDNRDILFLIPGFGQIFSQNRQLLEKTKNVRIYSPFPFSDMPDLYCLSDIVVIVVVSRLLWVMPGCLYPLMTTRP